MTGRHAADVPDEEIEVAPAPGVPTQVAHPVRALVRHLVAVAIGAGVALLARWGIDIAYLEVGLTEAALAGVWTLGSALAQWVLTRPAVERWLRSYLPGLATGVHTEH